MKLTNEELQQIIQEELAAVLDERCQKGYVSHPTRKTKKMFGRTYRNCVKPKKKKRRKVRESTKDNLDKYTADDFAEWYAQVQKYLAAEIKSGLFDPKKEEAGAYRSYVDGYTTSTYEEEWLASKGLLEKKRKKRKKAGTESSKESSLRDWFGRKGAKGKKKGWVDCNAPDGKGGYKSCGRSSGEKRKKYPACRPTPGACKERGKGKSWGKKAKKRGKRK